MIVAKQPDLSSRLARHMARPQRHRLLHGYPLAAAMPYADDRVRSCAAGDDPRFSQPRKHDQPLLVGVLPHPFCNPKIRGCGYCTFPHESFSAVKSATVVRGVVAELEQRLQRQPDFRRQTVAGLYFGGGTANLTPPGPFRNLASKLNQAFDLSEAEVSLEGVPARFVQGEPLLLDVLGEELNARHFRISMGIQTFDEAMLKRMGRLGFGRPQTFANAVDAAHQRGMTASGDLMFNLPGQSWDDMRNDVRRAVDIGLDQICLYHLVMFPGLGTVWSQDASLLAELPSNESALEHWCELREWLIGFGYRQTSLTNFERSEFVNDPRRYQYEPISYASSDCQVLGFGPGGISFSEGDAMDGLKTLNPESSAEYLQAVHHDGGAVWNRYFMYQRQDREILYLTRRLAALSIEQDDFAMAFEAEAMQRYEDCFSVFEQQGLLSRRDGACRLTPQGMFYSDSIAGVLVEQRRRAGALMQATNDNSPGHM